jgi:transposase
LQSEIDKLVAGDKDAKGLQSVSEFGRKTVAVLRAELGDLPGFQRTEQVIAYAGLDIEVKESGKWKGQAKLSKRGSGRLLRILYAGFGALCAPQNLGLWSLFMSSKLREMSL